MMGIFVLVKPSIEDSVCSKSASFQKAMASPTLPAEELAVLQAEGRLKVDPSITVADMQSAVDEYLKLEGTRNFQTFLDVIAREGTTWSTRPKVCIFLQQVCEAFC